MECPFVDQFFHLFLYLNHFNTQFKCGITGYLVVEIQTQGLLSNSAVWFYSRKHLLELFFETSKGRELNQETGNQRKFEYKLPILEKTTNPELREWELFLSLITYTLEFDLGNSEMNESSCPPGVPHLCLALDRIVVAVVMFWMVKELHSSWSLFFSERSQETCRVRLYFGVIDLNLG